ERLQRAALIGEFCERVPEPLALEEARSLVEVLLAADLEAQMMRLGASALRQHQRVVLTLLQRAQIQRTGVLVLDDEAERALVEGAGAAEVGNAQRDVARAYDVERRIEDVLGNGHDWFLRVALPSQTRAQGCNSVCHCVSGLQAAANIVRSAGIGPASQ